MCPCGHQGAAEGSSSITGAGVWPSPAWLCAGSRRRPSRVTLGQQKSLGSDPGPATNPCTAGACLALLRAPGAALWSVGLFQCGNSRQGPERGSPHTAAVSGPQTWRGRGGSWHPAEASSLTPAPGAPPVCRWGKRGPARSRGLAHVTQQIRGRQDGTGPRPKACPALSVRTPPAP